MLCLVNERIKFRIAVVLISYFKGHIEQLDNIVVTLQCSSGSTIWITRASAGAGFFGDPLHAIVYARHGRELMGCKSPVCESG